MDTAHHLVLRFAQQPRSLTRLLLLVEGRGFIVRDVRHRGGADGGADAEVTVTGPAQRLGHLLARVRACDGVRSADLLAAPAAAVADPVRVQRLRVHMHGDGAGPPLTDVTVALEVGGRTVLAAADAVDPLDAVAAAVRAALRVVYGAALDDVVVSDWSVVRNEDEVVVGVVTVGGDATVRAEGRGANLLVAAADAAARALPQAAAVASAVAS